MITNAYKKQILENLFGRRIFNIPSNFYLGVSSTDIAPNGTGVTEPSVSSGYARILVPNTDTNWSVADGNLMVSNLKTITMNEIKIPCDTATHFFLSDSLTGLPIIYEKLKPIDYRPMPKDSTIHINTGGLMFGIGDII